MGDRGPVPKRSTQRRRRNKPERDVRTGTAAAETEVPRPRHDWHPIAKRWYLSLAESGQSVYYEPSDWATAYLLAESMSRELRPQGLTYQGEVVSYHTMTVKAAMLKALLSGMSSLLVTEGDRRRVQVELSRPDAERDNKVVAELDAYRRRTQSSAG